MIHPAFIPIAKARRPQLVFMLALGAAIASAFFTRGWILRIQGCRAVRLTEEGRRALQRDLGLALEPMKHYSTSA
jgi:hypothetical protein